MLTVAVINNVQLNLKLLLCQSLTLICDDLYLGKLGAQNCKKWKCDE